jgi:hypothetical protein
MKKLLSMVLALAMIISVFSVHALAAKGGNGKADEIKNSDQAAGTSEELRVKLEKEFKDKEARKEIIKQIVAERKANNDHSIPVFANGKELKFDVPPVIKYGRTLIPVRAVSNALGADVAWDGATGTVTITKDKTVIIIKLGSNVATVNGVEVQLDAKPELISNRTLVPIRFIAETLKQNVEWDEDTGSVIIDDDDDDDDSTTPDAITVPVEEESESDTTPATEE